MNVLINQTGIRLSSKREKKKPLFSTNGLRRKNTFDLTASEMLNDAVYNTKCKFSPAASDGPVTDIWLKDRWLAKLIGSVLFQRFFCTIEPNIM